MPKLNISPQALVIFLFILAFLNPTLTSALITQRDDVDEGEQGQTVVSADTDSPISSSSPSLSPNSAQTGPKSIIPGWDDGSTIACIVGSISLMVVIPMFVYIWRRRRRLRRAGGGPPRNPDKLALVNRKGSLVSVDGLESPLPSPRGKLERAGTGVSFASEVTVMDQVSKPEPVFHAV